MFFLDLFAIKWENLFGQLLNGTLSLIPELYIKLFWFSNARWNRYQTWLLKLFECCPFRLLIKYMVK